MFRRLRGPVLACALLLGPAAFATTLLAFDTPELFAKSRVVAVVEVLKIETIRYGGRLATFADVRVARPVKGTRAGESLRLLVPGGVLGEWGQRVEGAPELHTGDTCLAFLEPAPGGLLQFVGLEQGRLAVRPSPDVPGGFVVQRTHEARLVGPAGTPVAPPNPDSEPLQPLLDRLDRLPGAGR